MRPCRYVKLMTVGITALIMAAIAVGVVLSTEQAQQVRKYVTSVQLCRVAIARDDVRDGRVVCDVIADRQGFGLGIFRPIHPHDAGTDKLDMCAEMPEPGDLLVQANYLCLGVH